MIKALIYLIGLVLIIAAGMLIGGANPQVIDFDFIAAKVSMPQSTLMAIWFGAGFLIALLFAAWQLSVRMSRRRLMRQPSTALRRQSWLRPSR